MNKTDEANIRFWVEKNDHTSDDKVAVTSTSHFSFPANIKTACRKWMIKQSVSSPVFFNAIFGLLSHRYIGSNSITFGFGTGYVSRGQLYTQPEYTLIESTENETLTVSHYVESIALQLKKNTLLEKEKRVRYLVLEKIRTPTKKNKGSDLSIDLYPLVILFDSTKTDGVSFFYNPHCFSDEVIKEIFNHLVVLIKETISDDQRKMTNLSILTQKEKKFYLDQLSSFSIESNNHTVCELFCAASEKYAQRYAVYHDDDKITYSELDALSSHLSHYLLQQGIAKGDTVCVYSDRNILLIVYMLAIFKSGAIFVPINAKYPPERVEFILADSTASIILTDQSPKFTLNTDTKLMQFQSATEIRHLDLLSDHNNAPSLSLNGEDAAYIIYTSGTTGTPKGVVIPHGGLVNLSQWYYDQLGVSEEDHASQFASQGFDTFFCETIPFLLTGASVHIVNDQIKLTPSLFFEWLGKHEITICDVPTAYAKVLFSLQWPSLPSLKMVKIGGESINRYPDKIFSFDIWNTYGPSEATIETTYKKIYSAYSSPDMDHTTLTPSIGKPLANSSVWIVDQYNQLVPHGVAGELLIGGINLAIGYWKKPTLTEQKFIQHSFLQEKEQRLYKSGDLVKMLPCGNLEYLGRRDNQIKIRGYRIELGEIESIMSQYPDVRDVAVIVKETANNEKQIYAYIAPNLEKQRFILQEPCLLKIKDRCIEALTENFSKGGVRLSSVSDQCTVGEPVVIELRLPGAAFDRSLKGHIIWHQNDQCGIAFDLNEEDKAFLTRSIQFYLSSQNTQEIISRSALKRNIKSILKKKLPEYMLPASVVTLLEMPMTFSGKIDKHSLPDPAHHAQRSNDIIQPKTEKEKKLLEIWSQLLNADQIGLGDSFFDLGGNSLLVAELSIRLLETFGVLIPVNVLFDLPYLSIQAEYLETGGTQYSTRSHVQELIAKDVVLPEQIRCVGKFSPTISSPKHILLTGAGGFLGIFLLKALLEKTQATIYCFVRKGNFETPVSRLLSVVESFQLQHYISIANRRIVIIGGDLALDKFGLPATLYESLAKKVDMIYHCGAQVNTMAAYDALRGSNVLGTLEIIKFAVHHVDKPIQYISTLSSANQKNDAGELHEVFPGAQYDGLSGGYAITKWVAERLLTEMSHRGLPVTIFRSGYIGGWSETGITNLNDALLMLIKGCIQLGVAPDLQEKITLLPVDFVGLAIAEIGLTFPKESAVYHVDHPIGIMWMDLIEWLNQYGYKIQVISLAKWQKLLSMISKQNALYPFLPYYLSLKEPTLSPLVNTTRFVNVLEACHLSAPSLSTPLLMLYFDFLRSVNFLPPLVVTESTKELSKN